MQSLVVLKKISDGMIRLHMHGSGHAADRVAANADADLYGINTEKKYYSPHEGDLFHAAYDGTLRVVEEAKGVWKNMDLPRAKGTLGKERSAMVGDRC